jgi:hypothetical protein
MCRNAPLSGPVSAEVSSPHRDITIYAALSAIVDKKAL